MALSIEIVGRGFSIRNYRKTADVTLAINMTQLLIPCDYAMWADDPRVVTQFSDQEFAALIKASPATLIIPEHLPEFPRSITYPLDDVLNRFGIDWLNCTPAYAIAWAMYKGFTEIHCHGLDFAIPADDPDVEDRAGQRRCVEMWLNHAKWQGYEIKLNPATFLFNHNREGLKELIAEGDHGREILTGVAHHYLSREAYLYGYQNGIPTDLTFDLGYEPE
jgi:hypothetical protein